MPHGARLAFHLAIAGAAVIVFASLYPFSGWRDPGIDPFSFVSQPLPNHVLWADFLINYSAYIVLGLLVSMAAKPKTGLPGALLLSIFFCSLLSLCMESLQAYLPARVSSNIDWLANSMGGMTGALISTAIRPRFGMFVLQPRESWIVSGGRGDAGIALITLWLFTQANPSLPLMGSWVLDEGRFLQRLFIPHEFSVAESGSIVLNMLSFGLFTSIILRPEKGKIVPVVLALFLAILIKSAAAGILLKPSVFFWWASQEALAGVGLGLALIVVLGNFGTRTRAVISAAAFVSQIVIGYMTPDIASPTAEIFLYSWRHGQLPTLNGVTSFVAKLWPLLTLAYLGFIWRKL